MSPDTIGPVPFDYADFGKRLKEARELRGLTGADINEAVGADRNSGYCSSWESARKGPPNIGFAVQIAERLEVSLDWLLSGSLPMQRPQVDLTVLDDVTKMAVQFARANNIDERAIAHVIKLAARGRLTSGDLFDAMRSRATEIAKGVPLEQLGAEGDLPVPPKPPRRSVGK